VVAAANIFNFFDDVNDPGMNEDVVTKEGFEARMQKISLAFRTVLRNPDVIAVSEAETLSGLRRLSARINADTIAAGGDDPKYEAYLVPGNDRRGINNGFLVKSSRVNVIEVSQLGKEERFRNERTGESNYLNDRPPLLVRVSVGEDDARFGVTLIANHLRSFLGYNDPDQGGNVRLKKRLQAEYLASIVESRLKADPSEKVIVLGDLNFYQFPDGILDVTGIIAGRPASKEEVMIFSPVSFTPPLANLVDLIDRGQRYSYVFDGNAQVLDHILVSGSLRPYVIGFGYARLNADFPEIYFNDPLRPERFSDHDPAVAYFSLRATSGN
jgi:predicted extracellular nuclease